LPHAFGAAFDNPDHVALLALLLHLGTMFVPLGQSVRRVEPVSLATMACVWALALSVFVAREI